MTNLRKTSIYESQDSQDSFLLNLPKKQKRCGLGMMKCLGCIIFFTGTSALSFYIGVKYGNHLEDNDGSL
tara:strand:+ start:310 stop:519 length:210 start_codon:yes stop_codon:yes gene_type:complete